MISLALAGLSFGKMAESTTRGDPSKPKNARAPDYISRKKENLSML
jgi:hypothetical protein